MDAKRSPEFDTAILDLVAKKAAVKREFGDLPRSQLLAHILLLQEEVARLKGVPGVCKATIETGISCKREAGHEGAHQAGNIQWMTVNLPPLVGATS